MKLGVVLSILSLAPDPRLAGSSFKRKAPASPFGKIRRSWATQLIRRIGCLLALSGAFLTGGVPAHAESDKEVQAHKEVLDLAGAFANDGFKMRDGHWAGILKPKENAVVAVNLYAGNQYWFSVGAIEPAKKVDVAVYDETGKLVQTESFSDAGRAAAGFSPTSSGQYFVSINLIEGDESTYCLVYSYK